MDGSGKVWYFSCMDMLSQYPEQIPVFNLFGETGAFPDVIHCERIWDRARLHGWEILPHRHREMVQIFYMQQGAARVRVDGRDFSLADGGFLLMPTQVVHGFSFRQGCEGLVLSFPLTVIGGSGSEGLMRRLGQVFTGQVDRRLVTLMEQIAEVFAGTGTFRANLLVALAQGALAAAAEIAERAAEQTEPLVRRRMLEFDRLLVRHMHDGWGVGDYASALSITPGHLNRLCRMATGETAARMIEIAVIAESCRLLAFTRLPVAEISYRLGYGDPAYFSRRFRLIRGE
ncbi:MAG TPA: helix-turn-helix domain-containing protein, partial [Paenirhodobacter sp.]